MCGEICIKQCCMEWDQGKRGNIACIDRTTDVVSMGSGRYVNLEVYIQTIVSSPGIVLQILLSHGQCFVKYSYMRVNVYNQIFRRMHTA